MDRTQLLSLSVGRHPNNAIQLDDPSVSGQHAIISVQDGRIHIVDAGSNNGTFVNGHRVDSAFIRPDDRVLLGTAQLPWHHPRLQPLVEATQRTGVTQPIVAPSHAPVAPSPAIQYDDEQVSLPTRVPRWLLIGGCFGVTLLLGAAVAVGAVVLTRGSDSAQQTTPASALPGAAPARTDSPTANRFDLSTPPLDSELYAARAADQIDLRRQEERVRGLRFRLQSRALRERLGADEVQEPRESWAVPLGIVTRSGADHLAVVTTRCVIDYRHPARQNRRGWRNLALFTGAGREREVFRISSPPDLAGAGIYDQQREALFFTSRYYLDGRFGDRYFNDLARDRLPGVEAVLPLGEWSTTTGVDIAVLYFPLADPGTAVLRPRRNLEVEDPEATLQEALGGRTNLWGDTFSYTLVSNECMDAMQGEVARLEAAAESASDRRLFSLLATAASFALLGGIIPPGLVEGLLGPVISTIVRRVDAGTVAELAGTVFRTLRRTLAGEPLSDVLWDEGGQLVLRFIRHGRVDSIVLAGLSRAGLADASASRVLDVVRSFAGRPGAEITVMRAEGRQDIASLFDPSSQMELSAELLRRGVVRLDTSDRALLAQQPGLVRAASDGLGEVNDSSPAVAMDPDYRSTLNNLASASRSRW